MCFLKNKKPFETVRLRITPLIFMRLTADRGNLMRFCWAGEYPIHGPLIREDVFAMLLQLNLNRCMANTKHVNLMCFPAMIILETEQATRMSFLKYFLNCTTFC